MKLRAALLGTALALLLPACGAHIRSDLQPGVPKIVGLQLRAAEQRLFLQHLRWRIAPGTQLFSRPLPPNVHSSLDDIPVTGQRPSEGTAVKRNAVVTIFTPCTEKHPCS